MDFIIQDVGSPSKEFRDSNIKRCAPFIKIQWNFPTKTYADARKLFLRHPKTEIRSLTEGVMLGIIGHENLIKKQRVLYAWDGLQLHS